MSNLEELGMSFDSFKTTLNVPRESPLANKNRENFPISVSHSSMFGQEPLKDLVILVLAVVVAIEMLTINSLIKKL